MSSNPEQRPEAALDQFVDRFLSAHGAVVEARREVIEALLPESLAAALETPEYIRIARGPGLETGAAAGEAYPVAYGSVLLEKMVQVACGQVPLVACQLHFDYLKRQGFDRLIRDQFFFDGAVGQVTSAAEIRTEYLQLTCRYLAQSDEQKEGLIDLVFNLETGAPAPGMADLIGYAARTYPTERQSLSLGAQQIQALMRQVEGQAQQAVAAATGPFQDSMNRRYRRDVANLAEYYASLQHEMETSLQRPGLSGALVQDRREKIALLPEELARKKEDLFKKYSIRVDLALSAAMLITSPAVKILYRAAVGRRQKDLALIYNPVTKAMDPLVCQTCRGGTFRVHFCPNLHLLCPDCRGACARC